MQSVEEVTSTKAQRSVLVEFSLFVAGTVGRYFT